MQIVREKEERNLDFEKVYKSYPRKLGKTEGIKKCQKEIKNQKDYELLLIAIQKYKNHCESNITEAKYIKYFSTFMGEWRDWLEEEAGTCSIGINWEGVFNGD